MKIKSLILFGIILYASLFIGASDNAKEYILGATNFDRLVLGEGNFGEDPNTTADITGANDEYISNVSNGSWNFGAADLTTTGVLTAGSVTLGATGGDTNSFQKTPDTNREKFYDTTTITGVTTSSVFIVSPKKAGVPVAGDLLAWHVITGKLVVSRADTTTSEPDYSWERLR
jgi:hypothetical protein